ncbi:MAG: glycosyltransferase [Gammaproteobacteria bacterium]|nr:MAG: glycosyltransferase [Gammaproteobacteria bacterium]
MTIFELKTNSSLYDYLRMSSLAITPVYFLVPGDINNVTGGYAYDRRLLAELHLLGLNIQLIELGDSFPSPDANDWSDANSKLANLPDKSVVVVDGLAFGVMGQLAQDYAQRLKFIALCHHPLALETGLGVEERRHLHQSEELAIAEAAAVLVTSKNTANILAQDFSVPSEKIRIALPGTDSGQFAPCEGQPPVLLTVATLTRRKAHDILIDAFSQLTHLPWQARFVGCDDFDIEWANYLRDKVSSYSLEDRVSFVGKQQDISSEYLNADIFVLPSLFEGYGMAFAEAISFGLPIIAAHTGSVPDVVPSNAGILVPPADANALANSLAKLLTNSDERKQLQLGAQIAAKNLPTWLETAKSVFQLIQEVNKQ